MFDQLDTVKRLYLMTPPRYLVGFLACFQCYGSMAASEYPPVAPMLSDPENAGVSVTDGFAPRLPALLELPSQLRLFTLGKQRIAENLPHKTPDRSLREPVKLSPELKKAELSSEQVSGQKRSLGDSDSRMQQKTTPTALQATRSISNRRFNGYWADGKGNVVWLGSEMLPTGEVFLEGLGHCDLQLLARQLVVQCRGGSSKEVKIGSHL